MVGTPLQKLVEWSSGGYPRPGASHGLLSSSPGTSRTGLLLQGKNTLIELSVPSLEGGEARA
ncbi:Hypothetical protein FKW44_022537 [Caligus rogercresseyi]|uniref:Uncharacterized protein n=1 Tax=Caligus rogercresseyi TaxID=217165 RepID=A0A7T8GNJ1_CALRO|nr:Hypothetical protein FKW44_022537 [Caligus rogercresseyi]